MIKRIIVFVVGLLMGLSGFTLLVWALDYNVLNSVKLLLYMVGRFSVLIGGIILLLCAVITFAFSFSDDIIKE